MRKRISFEEGINELEAIAVSLESGSVSLEESFKLYERALKLKNELQTILDNGDEKIRILTENGSQTITEEEIK